MQYSTFSSKTTKLYACHGGWAFNAENTEVGLSPMSTSTSVLLAVNGTLMRGLELNPNLLAVGATFHSENQTVPAYRLFSIGDRHPGMYRVAEGGISVAVEVWDVPVEGLASILIKEPAGLSIGKVTLATGEEMLGVLAEPILCAGQREISEFGGWRAYRAAAEKGVA